jgi:CubicO group peptidase (beta-lactamase class C family)
MQRPCWPFLLLLVAPTLLPAQPPPAGLKPERAAKVDETVAAKMADDGAIGLVVGVIEDGEVRYLKGYGWADRENKLPVTGRTLFRWASCSKPVTAVAAMQLVEKGLLDLDADVRTYVPEFPDPGAKITARQLLCHQGGIVHYVNGKVVATRRAYDTAHPFADVVNALDKFKESPLVSQPGAKYSYTTHGYILLSAVVQRAGRQPFAEQVRGRIAKPAQLTTLQPDYPWVPLPERTQGYRKRGPEVVLSADTDVSWKLGGGGFISSGSDFAGFAAGLINRRFVNEATETDMWTPQKLADGKATTYGLGFGVDTKDGRLRVSHSGAQEKTRTQLTLYPRERRGVVVMTNSEWVQPGGYVKVVEEVLFSDASSKRR